MVWGSKLEVTLPSLSAVERHELVSADLPLLRTEAGGSVKRSGDSRRGSGRAASGQGTQGSRREGPLISEPKSVRKMSIAKRHTDPKGCLLEVYCQTDRAAVQCFDFLLAFVKFVALFGFWVSPLRNCPPFLAFPKFPAFHTLVDDLLQFLLPVSRFTPSSQHEVCSRSSSSSVTPPPPQLVPAILPASHCFPQHGSSTGFVPTHSFRISLHQEKNRQVTSISTSRDELSATAATQSRWLISSP